MLELNQWMIDREEEVYEEQDGEAKFDVFSKIHASKKAGVCFNM
jgi:hypothetical protein